MQENPLVYFDINVGRYGDATKLGRVVMELKADVAPKTAENFRQLCLKPSGEGYAGSRFHRIIPEFMCQGGDFTNDNGTGMLTRVRVLDLWRRATQSRYTVSVGLQLHQGSKVVAAIHMHHSVFHCELNLMHTIVYGGHPDATCG
jgi:hypothetical protein